MASKCTLEYNKPAMRGLTKLFRASVLPEAMEHVATVWHRQILRGHFVAGASDQYAYGPRSADYLARKRSRGDLVFSGRLRQAVLDVGKTDIQVGKTGRRAVVSLSAPWYATFRRKNRAIDIKADVTAVNQRDVDYLSRLLEQDIVRGIAALTKGS